MRDFMTIKETAELWNLSQRWIQTMCANGKIEGAIKFGNAWAIPKDTKKPKDDRITTGNYINWRNKSKEKKNGDYKWLYSSHKILFI